MTLGQRIKALRTTAELSQKQLAELTGTTQQRVALWELDKQEPSISYMRRICTTFDCTPNDLLL